MDACSGPKLRQVSLPGCTVHAPIWRRWLGGHRIAGGVSGVNVLDAGVQQHFKRFLVRGQFLLYACQRFVVALLL